MFASIFFGVGFIALFALSYSTILFQQAIIFTLLGLLFHRLLRFWEGGPPFGFTLFYLTFFVPIRSSAQGLRLGLLGFAFALMCFWLLRVSNQALFVHVKFYCYSVKLTFFFF